MENHCTQKLWSDNRNSISISIIDGDKHGQNFAWSQSRPAYLNIQN